MRVKIKTFGVAMYANPHDGSLIEWVKGSHTANVYTLEGNTDCFTFAWEKNKASQLDFTSALESYLMGA